MRVLATSSAGARLHRLLISTLANLVSFYVVHVLTGGPRLLPTSIRSRKERWERWENFEEPDVGSTGVFDFMCRHDYGSSQGDGRAGTRFAALSLGHCAARMRE